jgi:hypothetical protein
MDGWMDAEQVLLSSFATTVVAAVLLELAAKIPGPSLEK